MILPTLYKTTKTGKVQVCKISTVKDIIETEYGQLNGKMQFEHTPCEPKNVGRSNETTGIEQAEKEAQAKWDKKVKSGYSEDISAPVTVQLPRKVGKWEPKRFKAGHISTPKYNGINIIYRMDDYGRISLWSRGGDARPPIPHLEADIKAFMDTVGSKEINVELYKHGEHLQDIQSAVTKPKELSTKLVAKVFDICDKNSVYSIRREMMNEVVDTTYVQVARGVVCDTLEDIEAHYKKCLVEGLEGTVIYSPDNIYVHNQRASDIWKYKPVLDAEFEIVGYEIDKNKCPVWIMQTATGKQFKAKPKGERELLQQIAFNAAEYIGRWGTVEYEMLSKDGKPLKPVFRNFRDCTPYGVVKE